MNNPQSKDLVDASRLKAFAKARVYSALFLLVPTIYAFYVILFRSEMLLSGQLNFNLMALCLFLRQDAWMLPAFLAGFKLKPYIPTAPKLYDFDRKIYLFSALSAIFLICWLGHSLIFLNYDLSRDEQMANFDPDIFVHLQLFAPIPLEWRHVASALNQVYILPIGNHEDWVSFYLPINAVFRAIFGFFLNRSLTSPTLVILGAIALWRVVGQLFPETPASRWVALALYAGSSQVIVTGMTAYAMTGHLALNLVWLTLFLNGTVKSDAAAVGIGFLATGLHQPIFHPLFVLPFLDLLRREGAWQRLTIYAGAYLAIIAFWLIWPSWISSFGTGSVPMSANPNGIGIIDRISHMLSVPNGPIIWIISLNLLRFVTWQHLMLLPLSFFGIRCGWKTEPIVRALTLGILLTFLATVILMPYQGHGWGYRYLHGLIGSACLLAIFGTRSLEKQGYSFLRPFLIETCLSIFILLPAHGFLTRQMVLPFEKANELINTEKADIAVIDDSYVPFGQDLVLNLPDLSNRPIRLRSSQLTAQDMRHLCEHYSISFLDGRNMQNIAKLFMLSRNDTITSHSLNLEKAASESGCRATGFDSRVMNSADGR